MYQLKTEIIRINAAFEESVKQFNSRIEKLKIENQNALKHQEEKQAENIQSLKFDFDSAHKSIQSEIDQLKKEHASELKKLKEHHHAIIQSINKQHERVDNEVKDADRPKVEEELTLMKNEYKEAVIKLKEEHRENIGKMNLVQEKLQEELKLSQEKHREGRANGKDDFAEELIEINKKCKQDLHDLDVNYSSQIKKIRAEKKVEIEAIKQKAKDDALKADEKLAEEKEDHKEKRFYLESKMAQLIESNSKFNSKSTK